MNSKTPPEFSQILNVQTLGEKPKLLHLVADKAARDALAERFALLSIEALAADLTVQRIGGGTLIGVRGRVAASITQSCIVSSAPVAAQIGEIIDENFGPPVETPAEIEISMDDIDPPEPIIDDLIDLGELVAQYLGVSVNPYPKAADAEIPAQYQDEIDDVPERVKNPFEALSALKKSQN